jgi:hypothetical protein
MGSESHARTKWKQGVANAEKLPLFEALCRHELCRTAFMSGTASVGEDNTKAARLRAVGKTFDSMGYPRLHDAVAAELISQDGAQQALQVEFSAPRAQDSGMFAEDSTQPLNKRKSAAGDRDGEQKVHQGAVVRKREDNTVPRRRRRNSVLREADFTHDNPLARKLHDESSL